MCRCYSVARLCLTLCNLMDFSMSGFSVLHYLQEFRFLSTELVMLFNHLILCCSFSSCPQSFPASGSFPINQLFMSGGQSSGASASASVLPMNIQRWFPLGLTDLIPLLSKGLSRVFSSTTVQKHQFFDAQLSLWSHSHINAWLVEKPHLSLDRTLLAK